MKKLCVIGDPIAHSKSPVMQTAMITALGLPYQYGRELVHPGETARWLTRAVAEGYAGFNATMPHKTGLVPLMDELDGDARRCGAVNTVCLRDGKVLGFNTDGAGFLRALEEMGVSPRGMNAVLLGAGGAAGSVALALGRAGARATVCNRTVDKAAALCARDPEHLTPAGFDDAALYKVAGAADLVMNCTSLGMEGTAAKYENLNFLEALPTGALVCDAIYAPRETALLARARELGHPAMNGLPMLVWQGVLALEHFAGTKFDEKAAYESGWRPLMPAES